MSNSNLPANTNSASLNNPNSAGNILNVRQIALSPTSYTARVTSNNPCAFVLMLDHSGSMRDYVNDNRGESKVKAAEVAQVVNKFIEEIILTCQRTDIIKDYFDLLILSYGKTDENDISTVSIAWEGPLSGKKWVQVNELRNSSLRKEIIEVTNHKPFGPRILKEERNIWIEPYADGLTPMKQAFEVCTTYIQEWVLDHPDSFPPMVFNITDGAVSDVEEYSELIMAAEKLKSVSTTDGNTLLFNLLLLDSSEYQREFPAVSDRQLFENSEYETALFDVSSVIPSNLKKELPATRNISDDVKALVFGSLDMILGFLNIGTSTLRNSIQ
jgi:hypothetical protein